MVLYISVMELNFLSQISPMFINGRCHCTCQGDFFGRILYICKGLRLEGLLIAKPAGHTVCTANICQL